MFDDYSEKTVSLQNTDPLNGSQIFSSIPRSQLKLSVTAFLIPNMGRYNIYPSFEWIGNATEINLDTFSFAIHANYWNVINTGNFDIYLSDMHIATIDRPTVVGFAARSYDLVGPRDVRNAYTGTGFIAARPSGMTLHNRIILNYSQRSPFSGFSINLGVFSISIGGAKNSCGEELTF